MLNILWGSRENRFHMATTFMINVSRVAGETFCGGVQFKSYQVKSIYLFLFRTLVGVACF